MTAVLALISGLVVGVIFGLLRLPIPAPPSIVGVLGIVGLWGGWSLVQTYLGSR